jgi:hypothetical protein
MAVLAVGGEADCFTPVSGQAYSWDTTGGRFNANASRGALKIVNAASEVELFFPGGNVTEAWIHAAIYQETQGTGDYIIIKNAAGDNAYKLEFEADGDWSIHFWSGAAWVELDITVDNAVQVADELFDLDIHILVDGTTGIFRVYLNEVLLLEFTGDTLGDTASFSRIEFNGFAGATNEMFISQVVAADEDTRGWVLQTHQATGAGTTTQWTEGAYTDIDEADYSEADFLATNTNNHVDTFAAANINAAFGLYTVKAVGVAVGGAVDAAATPNDIQAVIRSGTTDYPSSSLGFTNDGSSQAKQALYQTDPDTAATWTQSGVNAMEFGVKAVA